MASVSFFEEDDYKGNTRTFSGGYQAIYDASDYYYDNVKHSNSTELDDTINSLKTAHNTWLCLFSEEGYEGDCIKVGPNENIPNLHYRHDGNNMGFRNTIASFVIYDSKPDFWDMGDSHSAGDCWVKFYTAKRFTSNNEIPNDDLNKYPSKDFCLKGTCTTVNTGEVINTVCMEGFRTYQAAFTSSYGGGNIAHYNYNHPYSLTTGPVTWVRLYKDINFKNQISEFGPNSIIPDLSKYGAVDVKSLRIYNEEPNDWQGSSSTVPPMVLTIEKYGTGQKFESLIAGVLGCIPYVGSLASGILGALWPTSPDTVEVWNDLDNYMVTLVDGLIDQNNVTFLNNTLQGLGGSIKTYSNLLPSREKANELQNILDALDRDKPYFYSVTNPEKNLTYMVEFGMMTILMLAERVYNYDALSGGKTDSNPQAYADKLNSTIGEFKSAVIKAKKAAIDWRVRQITVEPHGSISVHYTLRDTYTGYSVEFSHEPDADNAQNKLVSQTTLQYEQLLEAKISPSFLWTYLRTENTNKVGGSGNANFPTTIFETLPTQKTVEVTTGPYGSNLNNSFTDNCNGHKISGLTLSTKDNFISSIQWHFENQKSGTHGNSGADSFTVMFDADEYIVSIYGGSGSYLDQFFIRTNKGRDIGTGGSGGDSFIAASPQGMDAQITSIDGYYGNYINQLTINWAYTVWR